MPAGDRTGPTGMGTMTGRGAGLCAGSTQPGYVNPLRGRGFCRGWRYQVHPQAMPNNNYRAAPGKNTELDMLKTQAQDVQSTMEGIQKRISELETENN